ncbi:hypothetical protein [Pseudoduganella sp. R-34]|uniref:hypothetical protein n=1 Tax=unclassified Pseudoduganella TaxID=2637179 RepID=UPI003CEBB3AC
MDDMLGIKKDALFSSFASLNWIDVNLFRLGTNMGEMNLTKQESAELLLDFFVKNDIGNKIADIKQTLREEIEQYLDFDESGITDLDRICQRKLSECPPV